MMAGCKADIVEVVMFASGADTFLAGGSPLKINLALTGKNIFELVHAGIGEKQGRVVKRNYRRRGQAFVAASFKEA